MCEIKSFNYNLFDFKREFNKLYHSNKVPPIYLFLSKKVSTTC
ncbi:hypothetical protein JJD26997_0103 [Campylobacter jejuni subsp. doylei 269.97]|uniref:Uncharacterized protein n=1 Tax=Campylobacter jejuni subsp. doylei (strain ATCC BAA-1458 / RM4099 / 269.97) TaxID=360109 RepID=A7H1H1_CAMJD|nr:hypothetical protein JJD26997_0103 [Campylobacter jejuni subsp. doylei 269.97]